MKQYTIKFPIGSIVWTMVLNKAVKRFVIGIKIVDGKKLSEDTKAVYKVVYSLENTFPSQELNKEEFEIFDTKENLLKSL